MFWYIAVTSSIGRYARGRYFLELLILWFQVHLNIGLPATFLGQVSVYWGQHFCFFLSAPRRALQRDSPGVCRTNVLYWRQESKIHGFFVWGTLSGLFHGRITLFLFVIVRSAVRCVGLSWGVYLHLLKRYKLPSCVETNADWVLFETSMRQFSVVDFRMLLNLFL